MKPFFRIILCIAVCLVMSLPFAVLVLWNIRPEPYGGLSQYSTFRIASVCFFIQHILALIGQFLLLIRYGDKYGENDNRGCAPIVPAVLSAFCSWQLSWKGEFVNTGLKFGSYDHFRKTDISAPLFWIYLTLIWAAILYSTIMLVSGKFSDD